jgi:hypothetical protein
MLAQVNSPPLARAVKRILLWSMPNELMLVVAHPSGVVYQNQVGGVVCAQEELEGVLAPLDVDSESAKRIMDLPYPAGIQGITPEVADAVDAVLASQRGASFVKVDRERLGASWEAWVHVWIETPERDEVNVFGPYQGDALGFGRVRGVLTWPNSD